MPRLPLWARALRGIDRIAWYSYHAHEIVRDELLFAWLEPELRSTATVAAYSDMRTYLAGGATFEGGLFGWETTALANPCLPRSGHILLAAAGGGRELKALLDRGFAVTAFEPNPVLFAGASAVADGSEAGRVLRATYQDLVLAADGSGPLAELREQQFAAVLFGWGSFTHLTERQTQVDVLRAARRVAPQAPLMLSYFLRKPLIEQSRSQRMRDGLRQVLRRIGDANPVDPGLGYDSGGGFVYSFTASEIAELASLSGYRVAVQDVQAFPYAILLPV